MELSEEMIEEFKNDARKAGKEISDEEAQRMGHSLIQFADLMWDCWREDSIRKQKLKQHPDGYPVDGNYSCTLCGDSINPSTGWYDKYGSKCLLCQSALDKGQIPTFVFVNRDSYYPTWKLTHDLNIKTPTLRKFVKEAKLFARTIFTEAGRIHTQIFLKKENPDLIEKFNPIRKSYNRHREKLSIKWAKQAKEEFKSKYPSSKPL